MNTRGPMFLAVTKEPTTNGSLLSQPSPFSGLSKQVNKRPPPKNKQTYKHYPDQQSVSSGDMSQRSAELTKPQFISGDLPQPQCLPHHNHIVRRSGVMLHCSTGQELCLKNSCAFSGFGAEHKYRGSLLESTGEGGGSLAMPSITSSTSLPSQQQPCPLLIYHTSGVV